MAAELPGVPLAEFVAMCGQHGVSVFQQTAEELIADVKASEDTRLLEAAIRSEVVVQDRFV